MEESNQDDREEMILCATAVLGAYAVAVNRASP